MAIASLALPAAAQVELAQTHSARPIYRNEQRNEPRSEARAERGPVIVSGTVPDEATRVAVLTRLREVYGAEHVIDQLGTGGVVAPPNWAMNVQKILGPNLKQVSRGQLAIDGNAIELRGEVANEAVRQQVVSEMATQLNPTYTVRNALRVAAAEQDAVDDTLGSRIIEFNPGSSQLTPRGLAILDELADTISRINRRIEVIGHTDADGSRMSNIALSIARAEAVRIYLIGKGIAPSLVSTSGAGPDRPIASNATEDGRARNRRIEFRVSR